MTHRYGIPLPAPPIPLPGTFPAEFGVGDQLLGYVGHYLKTIMDKYVGVAWNSVQPNKPLVRTILVGDPDDGFNETTLPALYIFRSPRETRELVETFEDVADDYRFEKSRVTVQWIVDPMPQMHRRLRNEIMNALRKAIDMGIRNGRDPGWIVPGDTDIKAPSFGSSLSEYAHFATLELLHAAPGKYIHKMAVPAPPRKYDELRMSLYVEELLELDMELIGDPHEQMEMQTNIPDLGTGLGSYQIGLDYLDVTSSSPLGEGALGEMVLG